MKAEQTAAAARTGTERFDAEMLREQHLNKAYLAEGHAQGILSAPRKQITRPPAGRPTPPPPSRRTPVAPTRPPAPSPPLSPEAQALAAAGGGEIELLHLSAQIPREERLLLLRAKREVHRQYLNEIEAGRTDRALGHLRAEEALAARIQETYTIPRLNRFLEEWKVVHARLAILATVLQKTGGALRQWPKWAGMITFALFIFEEASQAFGFLLSMGIRGEKDRMSDPDVTTDAQFKAWLNGVEHDLDGFKAEAHLMQWWVDYPGIVALFFADPYEHYAAVNWGQVAEMERLIQEIKDDRATAQAGTATPATAKRATGTAIAVGNSFEAVQGISFNIGDFWNKGYNPDIPSMREYIADMEAMLKVAVKHMDDNRKDLQRAPAVITSLENQRHALEKSIEHWKKLIERYQAGGFTGEAPGETMPPGTAVPPGGTPPIAGQTAIEQTEARLKAAIQEGR